MPTCNRPGCGKPIKWINRGGKNIPLNPDGTDHHCSNNGTENGETIIGRLDAFTVGSATFILKDGKPKTYALTPVMSKQWTELGYGKGTWLEFTIDTKNFVHTACLSEKIPEWASELPVQLSTAANTPASHQEKSTSPMSAPAEQKKGPISRDLLISMVNNPDTYWKAKILMDIEAHESICRQVEWKNWNEAISLAIEAYKAIDFPEGTNHLTTIKSMADDFHTFIKGKAPV